MNTVDKAVSVREGEELDKKKIEEYLKDSIPGLQGELVISQFPSGFSNLTYLISIGDREMVLRRPPFGKKAKTAHDMNREYKILSVLKPVYPYCPEALVYCDDDFVMDSPFYVMERIKGIILRKDFPGELNFSEKDAERLCDNLIDVHCKLHSLDYKSIGLDNFGKPEGYVKRQVDGWSRRYRDARTPDAPDFEQVMEWLDKNQPEDYPVASVIHNDYKFDNVILNPENPLEIIGVLDWEMATLGDPLMDLGSSLAYWITGDDPESCQLIRQMPTNYPGMLSREELVDLYAGKMNFKIDDFSFYYCFGLFRLAVIAQQIYYRYFHGQTMDARFKMLIFAVKILDEMALGVIEKR